MFRIIAVVLVCALLPQAGRAQDTSSPPPPDAPLVAPPLVSAPEDVEPEEAGPGVATAAARKAKEEPPVSTGPRIILETLSGGAGTFAGGLVGALLGLLASGNCAIIAGDCTSTAVMGLGGMAVGAAVTTYAAGNLMKGRGGFMSTLIGSVLGTGAGLLLVAADNGDGVGVVGLLALPALGSMAGYELSRNLEDPARFSLTGPSVSAVAPSFGTTPQGGFVGGLSGRF